MATFKHISYKNARYSDAEKYLLFKHDEFTMKPILDDNGRLIPRQDYRIATLNCDGQDFAVACMRANLKYGKNQSRDDVKSHHFVVASSTFLASRKQQSSSVPLLLLSPQSPVTLRGPLLALTPGTAQTTALPYMG